MGQSGAGFKRGAELGLGADQEEGGLKRAEEGALVDSVGEREWAVDLLERLTSGLGEPLAGWR